MRKLLVPFSHSSTSVAQVTDCVFMLYSRDRQIDIPKRDRHVRTYTRTSEK